MRIGIFSDTYTPNINGVATSINTFTDELKRNGHDVFIFAPNSRFRWELSFEKQILKFPSVEFYGDRRYRFGIPLLLRKKLQDISLDIVHTQTPFPIGIWGLWFALSHKVPLVYTHHTRYQTYDHYLHIPEFMRKQTVKRMMGQIVRFINKHDIVVAPSSGVKRELAAFGVKKPINVIPTGVDIGKIAALSNVAPTKKFLSRFNIDPAAELIIFTSRLGKEKNIDFLLRSMQQVFLDRPAAHLIIIGDGKQKNDLRRQVEWLGIAKRVTFTGFLAHEEIFSIYKMAKVFVFSSFTETQGLVLLEAMAAGLPVVALKATGTEDIVNESNGFLVEAPDVGQFARTVEKILTDATVREKKAKGAEATVQEFSIQKTTHMLLATYEQAIQLHRRGR